MVQGREPDPVNPAVVGADALPAVPQDEHELAGALRPESAWMFVWGRRVLRDLVGDRVSRFLVGRLEPGHWSVLRGDAVWLAVRCADDVLPAEPSHAVSFGTAQAAVAYAAAGLIVDEKVTVHSYLLRDLDIVEHVHDAELGGTWGVTEEGRRAADAARVEERPRYGRTGIALEPIIGRPAAYRVLRPGPPSTGNGPFIGTHEIFLRLVEPRLPGDFGASTGEELPEGTLLEGFGSTDQEYLFTMGTPFERRGLSQTGIAHTRHFYVVRRPLWVYQGFPVKATPVPASGLQHLHEPSDKGRGYLMHGSIAALLASGELAEVPVWEAARILNERRERKKAREVKDAGTG
ncbi:glycohydrolase toxin TNT-related protein [Actinomadura sp. 9N407]|uniref:glycohydrolase toxin TNT-related protein n=1 Tax=Actinomadura sp. 9N407 TaxID=3375154 RepID=UPI00378994C7